MVGGCCVRRRAASDAPHPAAPSTPDTASTTPITVSLAPAPRAWSSVLTRSVLYRTLVLGICLSQVDLECGRADSGGGGGLPAHASAAGGVVLPRGGLPGVPGAVALAGRIRVPGQRNRARYSRQSSSGQNHATSC